MFLSHFHATNDFIIFIREKNQRTIQSNVLRLLETCAVGADLDQIKEQGSLLIAVLCFMIGLTESGTPFFS